jgi:hypothetical protein
VIDYFCSNPILLFAQNLFFALSDLIYCIESCIHLIYQISNTQNVTIRSVVPKFKEFTKESKLVLFRVVDYALIVGSGGKNKIQDTPGDKGQDKADQALDIHECIDGYPFHSISSKVFEGDRNNKQLVIQVRITG